MMANTLDSQAFQARLERLDALLRAAHSTDAAAQGRLQEIVQELLDLHGAGLERLLNTAAEAVQSARRVRSRRPR
jgi:hypothetical protein